MPTLDRAALSAVLSTTKATDIIGAGTQESFTLNTFPTERMAKNVSEQPFAGGARPTAGFVTEADTGSGVKPVTSFGFGTSKMMTAAELACIVTVHDNVLADADIDLAAYMEPLVTEAMGIALDDAILFGTNAPASWPDANIVGKAIAAGNRVQNRTGTTPPINLDLAEQFNQALARIEEDNYNPTDVFVIPALRSRFRGLRDTTGQPVYLSEYRGDGSTEQIYGKPLQYLTGNLVRPSVFEALILDRNLFKIGIRDDIRVTASNQAVVNGVSMFQTDQTAFRFTFRVAFASNVPTAATTYPASVIQPTIA